MLRIDSEVLFLFFDRPSLVFQVTVVSVEQLWRSFQVSFQVSFQISFQVLEEKHEIPALLTMEIKVMGLHHQKG